MPRSLKHSRALLGSKPVGNRTAVNDDRSCVKRLLVKRRPFPFHDMLDFTQCQKKTTDESLAVLLRHPAVVVEVLFEVGESPFDLVVGIGHPDAFRQLVGEEVRQVEVDAVHGRTNLSVGELRLSRLQGGTPVQHVHPFGLPMPVLVLEFGAVLIRDVVHEGFQLSGRKQPGMLGEVPSHYLYHVVLAHLDLVGRQFAEEALHPVYHDPPYGVSALFNAAYSILIVLHTLMRNKRHVERFAGIIVQCEFHSPDVPPVSGIEVHDTASLQPWMHPVLFYLAQPFLDGGVAHSECCDKLRYGLLAILIASP